MNRSGRPQLETDIVVVGGGGSGLAAAVEAARLDAKVVLLEKNPTLGGTTGRSVGSITASCTRYQIKENIKDSPEEHAEDMALFAGPLAARDNSELRKLLADNSPETIKTLEDLGIVFFGPLPEPPHRVPRMHNILPSSRSFIYHMENRARRAGVDIRVSVRARKLLREGLRAVGVEAEIAGSDIIVIRARKGVILAAGDYSSAKEIKADYASSELADIEGINPASTGDGQRLVLEAGGVIVNGDIMWGPEIRFPAPPEKKLLDLIPPIKPVALMVRFAMRYCPPWLLRPFLMMFVTTHLAPSRKLLEEGAILVNKLGKRFVDERGKPELAIPRQPDRIAYYIFDDAIARKFAEWPYFISTAPGVAYAYLPDYRRNRKDVYASAASIEGLAKKIGVPANELAQTVSYYNSVHPAGLPPVNQPPFYALGPAKSWIVFTDGGAQINAKFQVLDKHGAVIPGLYAAGSNGQGGVILQGHGHHLGWAFTSGRLAARSAVANA
jgi:succinate dehydrogenase/fumarate reductase flavoprotein subunit